MLIVLTGNDDLLVGEARDLLVKESGLDVSHVRLDDLLEGKSNVAEAELLILLTREQEPDNAAGWVSQINPEKGRVRRLVLCMPRPIARTSGLLLKHADEIISPAGFYVENFVERVLGLLILEKWVEPYKSANGTLYGATKRMRAVYSDIERYAPSKETVLIPGETGTGKELVARAIHESSPRRKKALVALNCAAVPEQLLEDELFGHVKGAFTGAQAAREGRFEQADGGTLFLDEIGDMSLSLQAKLLRVLQEREFEKLGSSRTVKVDVRVVAATSRDLRKDVEEGKFRRDLYARINRAVLELPPLRERKADIPLLAEHFKEMFNGNKERAGERAVEIEPGAIDELFCIDWQENVRDLDNVVVRAAMNAGPDGVITDTLMRESMRRAGGYGGALGQAAADGPFRTVVFRPEEEEWRKVRDKAEAAYFKAIIEIAMVPEKAIELSGMKKARFYAILKKHRLSFDQ